MSIPNVIFKHAFGLKGDASGNIAYLNDGRVAYPVGNTVVFYTPKQDNNEFSNTQTFLPDRSASEVGLGITAMATSSKFLAIAERCDFPSVTIYDVTHGVKRRKQCVMPELENNEIISMAFDRESKHLVALGAPDYCLSYWSLDRDREKCVVTHKVCQTPGETATMVSFHPSVHKQDTICVTGFNNLVRLFKFAKESSQLKPGGPSRPGTVQKPEPQNYLCHQWVSDDLLMLGSDAGHIGVVIGFELSATTLPFDPSHNGETYGVTSIIACATGFIAGTDAGVVHIYERIEGGGDDSLPSFSLAKTLRLPTHTSRVHHMALGGPPNSGVPAEADLIVTTDQNQAYILRDYASHGPGGAEFEPLAHKFHRQGITGMDICVRKSLVATCSTDRSVRVWDYLENSLALSKYFQEEAHAIALHPSGLQVLVGFSDKLRLMNLLGGVDDIVTVREFAACRACKEVQFSNGGQYFAAMRDTLVHVYNSYTFDAYLTLNGHIAKVKSISWSPDDSKVLTAGQDGAIFEWDLTMAGKRSDIDNNRTGNYSSALRTSDGRTVYAVGSDRKLKEIDGDTESVRDLSTRGALYTQVCVSRSNRVMFAGTDRGAVRALRYPMGQNSTAADFTEVATHNKAVTRLRISHDERYVFSASEDGSLFIAEVRESATELGSEKNEVEVPFSEEILITRAALDKKDERYRELEAMLDSERAEWQYQVDQAKQEAEALERQLQAQHQAIWESLRQEKLTLQQQKQELQHTFASQLELIEEQNGRSLEKDKRNNEDMVKHNERKYDLLMEQMARQAEEREKERKSRLREAEEQKQEMEAQHMDIMSRKERDVHRLTNEAREARNDYEATKILIEDDANEEIQERIHSYQGMIDHRDEAMLKLKGQVGIMHKNSILLKEKNKVQESKTQKSELSVRLLEEEKQRQIKRIDDLRKEVSERIETIKDKEARIHELKKKNQELEKFKFVLEYKNKELTKQLEPRDEQIAEQIKRISDMDSELEKYWKNNTTLRLTVENLEMKSKALEKEISSQQGHLNSINHVTQRFRSDLHEAVTHLDQPKVLKEAVKEVYQRHVAQTVRDSVVEGDAQSDNNRQREYLERSVASLKRKLTKDVRLHRADNARIMQENVALIKEVNVLRREHKQLIADKRKREDRFPSVGAAPLAAPVPLGPPTVPARASSSGSRRGKSANLPPHVVARLRAQREEMASLRQHLADLRADDGEDGVGVSTRPMSGVEPRPMTGLEPPLPPVRPESGSSM